VGHGLSNAGPKGLHPVVSGGGGSPSVGAIVSATAVMVAVLAVAALARPARYVVEGVSMAPRLLPGDVVTTGWFPFGDRFRGPGRYECWTVALADHAPAVKRIAGLPGEAASLIDGDLVVDGAVAVKGPRVLAEVGSVIERCEPTGSVSRSGSASQWLWIWPSREVLDDATVVETRSRVLLPVHDVGLSAIVRMAGGPAPGGCRVRIRVGDLAVPWRLTAAGRHALVAGRLDGSLVAVAWPLPSTASSGAAERSCLPAAAPVHWQVVMPWPAAVPASAADDAAPPLAIELAGGDATAVLEQVTVWRDVLYRPANQTPPSWQLGVHEYLVLGDFPSESSDSRQWGPVPRDALHHRVSGY